MTITIPQNGDKTMTETRQEAVPAADLPAVAACTAHHQLPESLAEEHWRAVAESEKAHFRSVAAAAVTAARDAGTPGADVPASEEAPVYAKVRQERADGTLSSSLWMITCDEGWRESVLCADLYERDADFLVSLLGRTPRGAR